MFRGPVQPQSIFTCKNLQWVSRWKRGPSGPREKHCHETALAAAELRNKYQVTALAVSLPRATRRGVEWGFSRAEKRPRHWGARLAANGVSGKRSAAETVILTPPGFGDTI